MLGEFPKLETIGDNAFELTGNEANSVNLTGLSALTTIGRNAFKKFKGTLTISGIVPSLATIGDYAFQNAGNTDSSVTFDEELPASVNVGALPIYLFRGNVFVENDVPIDKNRLNAGWPNK